MKRPVHIVPVWSAKAGCMMDVVMPGIGLYRILAARTGQYCGKSEPEFGPDVTRKLDGVEITYPAWCKVTVFRQICGQTREFSAKEFWIENYATAKRGSAAPNAMWKRRPYGQLAKCAESQALRMAFPEEAGGTYTAEEMEGRVVDVDYREEPEKAEPERRRSLKSETAKVEPAKSEVEKEKPLAKPSQAEPAVPELAEPVTEISLHSKVQAGVDKLLEALENVKTISEMNEIVGSPKVAKQREYLANSKDPETGKYLFEDLWKLLEDGISATVERLASDSGFG
jgi:phage recombination protein Bet